MMKWNWNYFPTFIEDKNKYFASLTNMVNMGLMSWIDNKSEKLSVRDIALPKIGAMILALLLGLLSSFNKTILYTTYSILYTIPYKTFL